MVLADPNRPVDNRTINWVVDTVGLKGKTIFADWYTDCYASYSLLLEPAHRPEMIYLIKPYHKVIFVNIPRSTE